MSEWKIPTFCSEVWEKIEEKKTCHQINALWTQANAFSVAFQKLIIHWKAESLLLKIWKATAKVHTAVAFE